MPDLEGLLERGAPPEPGRPPVESILRRGRRRRTRRRAAVGAGGVGVGAVIALAAVQAATPPSAPVIESPPSEPDRPSATDTGVPPASLALGPELTVDDLAGLPEAGVAIQVGDTIDADVVFVGYDGTVIGHLDPATLDMPQPPNGGRPTSGPLLLLVQEIGVEEGYVQVGDGDVRRLGRQEQWAMARGHRLERVGTGAPAAYRLMSPTGATGHELSTGGDWSIGAGREVVAQSFGRVRDGASAEAYDLVTGDRVEIPVGCLPHDRVAEGIVLVCWDPDAGFEDRDWATVEVQRDDGSTEQLMGPFARPGQPSVSGLFRSASISPDGRWVGASWSGECESPAAMVAERGTSIEPRPLVAVDGHPAESRFHGWTADSRALVTTTEGLCGTAYDVPGLYLVDPTGGAPELLWPASPGDRHTIQPWGPLEP